MGRDGLIEFSVMSFNVRFDNDGDKRYGRGWEDRKDSVHKLITESDVDIVGTQEGLSHQLRYFRTSLLQFSCFGNARDCYLRIFPCGEHCAVLCRSEFAEPLRQSTFALSETPNQL